MHSFRTHYQNLQVTENASPEVIRGAYRFLSQKWHPDKNPDNREEAERISKIINEAYAVLSDPERRREHDAWIAEQRAQAEAEQTARDPEDSSADDQDAGDSAEAQAAAAHRAALRATYAEGAAKSGRIGAFAWALLGSLFLMDWRSRSMASTRGPTAIRG